MKNVSKILEAIDFTEMTKKISTITIERFDPGRMHAPELQTYQMPFEEGLTVMDALLYIHRSLDGSLAFRASCLCGLCYVCRIRIDGKERCPCKTFMKPSMVLKPLPNQKVIRDLVVEFDTAR